MQQPCNDFDFRGLRSIKINSGRSFVQRNNAKQAIDLFCSDGRSAISDFLLHAAEGLVGAPRFELGTPSPPDEFEYAAACLRLSQLFKSPLHSRDFQF